MTLVIKDELWGSLAVAFIWGLLLDFLQNFVNIKLYILYNLKYMALTEKWKKLWEEVFWEKHRKTMKEMKTIASKLRKTCKD